jgi:antitoxin component of RelBE/YafQ-DinJ toxin-antitoxin module
MPQGRDYLVRGKVNFELKLKLDKYRKVFGVTESQIVNMALEKFLNERK